MVNNENFLTKLHLFDSEGATASWGRSCLTDRKQMIEIKSSDSSQFTY
jgi:hypothetical protein